MPCARYRGNKTSAITELSEHEYTRCFRAICRRHYFFARYMRCCRRFSRATSLCRRYYDGALLRLFSGLRAWLMRAMPTLIFRLRRRRRFMRRDINATNQNTLQQMARDADAAAVISSFSPLPPPCFVTPSMPPPCRHAISPLFTPFAAAAAAIIVTPLLPPLSPFFDTPAEACRH